MLKHKWPVGPLCYRCGRLLGFVSMRIGKQQQSAGLPPFQTGGQQLALHCYISGATRRLHGQSEDSHVTRCQVNPLTGEVAQRFQQVRPTRTGLSYEIRVPFKPQTRTSNENRACLKPDSFLHAFCNTAMTTTSRHIQLKENTRKTKLLLFTRDTWIISQVERDLIPK